MQLNASLSYIYHLFDSFIFDLSFQWEMFMEDYIIGHQLARRLVIFTHKKIKYHNKCNNCVDHSLNFFTFIFLHS